MRLNGMHRFIKEFTPRLDNDERSVALAIYRGLVDGGQVSLARLSEETRLSRSRVDDMVSSWPGVYRDQGRDIVGFWGLTAQPMSKHVLQINGTRRYAWCAWDCLFLPSILGQTVQAASVCPQTGAPIALTISPTAAQEVQPGSTVLSMLIPEVASCRQDVVSSFCHFVHFFRDRKAAKEWTSTRPGTHVISLEKGIELGHMKNEWQFGQRIPPADRSREAGSRSYP